MGNSCSCLSRSNRVGDISLAEDSQREAAHVAQSQSVVSIARREEETPSPLSENSDDIEGSQSMPATGVDFTQQCYDGESRPCSVRLTPQGFRRVDFSQQCYESQNRPSSSQPVIRPPAPVIKYEYIREPSIAGDGHHRNMFQMVICASRELEDILDRNYRAEGHGLGT